MSRDAEDIIIAIKTGKLSVASNSQDTLHETAGKEEDEMNASLYNNPQTPTKSSPGSPISLLVKPCNRKNAASILYYVVTFVQPEMALYVLHVNYISSFSVIKET